MWWKSSFTHNNVVIYISSLSDYTSTIAMYYKGFCSYNNKHLWLNKIQREDDFFTIFRRTPQYTPSKESKGNNKMLWHFLIEKLEEGNPINSSQLLYKRSMFFIFNKWKKGKNNNKIIAFYYYKCFFRYNIYIGNSFIQLSTKCVSIYLFSSHLPIL